jgi:hypothetical protein
VPAGWVNNPTMTKLRSFAVGMSDPVLGVAQVGANALPDSTGVPQRILQAIDAQDRNLQAERGPDAGFDYARAAGNIGSPGNLWGAAFRPATVAPVVNAAMASGSRYTPEQLSLLAKLLSAGASAGTGKISRSGHSVSNTPHCPGRGNGEDSSIEGR